MTYNINKMIEQTKNMPNVSDGGSECFSFGDVVLVKYVNINPHIARPTAEESFRVANEKNAIGVRTPKNLAIKREEVGNQNICWVLQEKAPGVCFSNYCLIRDPQAQLAKQRELVEMKDEYFQRLILDLKELMYAGIELKPKNIFLDNKTNNGGFTIIDLISKKGTKTFSSSLEDFSEMLKCIRGIFDWTIIRYKASEEEKILSKELRCNCLLKSFKAIETSLPEEFQNHRRFVLRLLTKDELKYFKNNGYDEDLTLTEEEEKQFSIYCKNIVEKLADAVVKGEKTYNNIESNIYGFYIGDLLGQYCYSAKNNLKLGDFGSYDDYEKQSEIELGSKLLEKINNKIINYVQTNNKVDKDLLNVFEEIQSKNIDI